MNENPPPLPLCVCESFHLGRPLLVSVDHLLFVDPLTQPFLPLVLLNHTLYLTHSSSAYLDWGALS